MTTSQMFAGATALIVALVAILVIAIVAGSQVEMRLAPEGGLEPIPTWWLNSQSPPPQ